MKQNHDTYGSYVVIVVNPIPKVAVYHALDWDLDWQVRSEGEYTRCGRGPVDRFRVHGFSLLDPARVRACRDCYEEAA